MNREDTNLRKSFEDFDRTESPSVALRQKIQADIANHDRGNGLKRLWFAGRSMELLAAALLVAVLFGAGYLALPDRNSGSETTSPTLTAGAASTPVPDDLMPVMQGGSAAQDNSFPGVIPPQASFRKLWQTDDSQPSQSGFFGTTLFVQENTHGDTATSTALTAYEAATGTILWQETVSTGFGFAVDKRGVYVALPAQTDTGGSGYRIALFDLRQGQPIWRTDEVFPWSSPDSFMSGTLIDGDSLIFQPNIQTVVALNIADGSERWRNTSAAADSSACSPRTCSAPPAIADGVVYRVDPGANQIVALAEATGATLWAVPFLNDSQLALIANQTAFASVQLTATPYGALVGISISGQAIQGQSDFRLLGQSDGAAMWDQAYGLPGRPMSLAHNWLFLTIEGNPDDDAPRVLVIDIQTGQVLATHPFAPGDPLNVFIYLPKSNVLLGGLRSVMTSESLVQRVPGIGHLFGKGKATATIDWLDPDTLAVIGSADFEDCFVDRTVSSDGKIVCENANGNGFAVYGPKP